MNTHSQLLQETIWQKPSLTDMIYANNSKIIEIILFDFKSD